MRKSTSTFLFVGMMLVAAIAAAETPETFQSATQRFPTVERSTTVPAFEVSKGHRATVAPKPLVRPFLIPKHRKAAEGDSTVYLRVPPGVRAVAGIDPVSGVVTYTADGENGLEPLGIFRFKDGLDERIPDWLKPALAASLLRLPEDQRARMVYLLANETDSRLLDEIAFVLAHSSPEDLSSEELFPEVLAENARALYSMAENIEYAELIEDEEAGQTTVRYHLEVEGQPTDWDLPPEYYYWFVVHPKLDWERFRWANPKSGNFGTKPNGVFWRDYFANPTNEPPFSHIVHKSMLEPNELHGVAFEGIQADAALLDFEIGPIVLAKRDQDGLAATIEFVYGNNSTSPKPDGSVLATTIPAAKQATEGNTALLENLVHSANNNRYLYSNSSYLIVKNRDSYGGTPIENLLQDNAAKVDVTDTANLISALNDYDYNKIILAEAQDKAFYQAIAEYDTDTDDWASVTAIGRNWNWRCSGELVCWYSERLSPRLTVGTVCGCRVVFMGNGRERRR